MANEKDAQLAEEAEPQPEKEAGDAQGGAAAQPQAPPAHALLGPAGIVDPAGTGAVAGAVVLPADLPEPPPGTGRRKAPEGASGQPQGHDAAMHGAEGDSGEYRGWQPSGSPNRSRESGSGDSGTGESETGESGTSVDGAAQPGPTARRMRETGRPEPAAALTSDRLLSGREVPPAGGWRRWLYEASFGYVNLGDSEKVRQDRVLAHRIASRLGERTRYVPVLSRKGGVGKTTVTMLLGLVLAEMREDRVIAMDANPDRGTLSDRSPGRADYTARDLLRNRFDVDTLAKLAAYVSRDGSRLDVLASDTDPAIAEAFDDADYRAVTDILNHYYSIVLTDSGTGMVHSVMKGALEKADAIVLVSGGSVDEARLASETLSWLEAHGRHDLVSRAIVVINLAAGDGIQVDVDEIEAHFSSRVKAVLRLPYDRHLAEGSQIQLNLLRPQTEAAARDLAALVVDELRGI